MNLNDFIMANEVTIRFGFFFGVFAVMAVWEVLAPKRALTVSKLVRWVNNLGLVFLNSVILRLLFPTAAVGVAAFAAARFHTVEIIPGNETGVLVTRHAGLAFHWQGQRLCHQSPILGRSR